MVIVRWYLCFCGLLLWTPIGALAAGQAERSEQLAESRTAGEVGRTEPRSASISEINRALTDPAQTVPRELAFQGVVTFVSRGGDFCLQQEDAGVMVEPPAGTPRPAMGDLIQVIAPIQFQTTDATDPSLHVRAQSVRRLGTSPLPDPVRPWLAIALNGGAAGRWVEVEGVVMQAMVERGLVRLHLTDTSGWAVVTVHDWRGQSSVRDWWGAHLRVQATNIGRGHDALRATSSAQIHVLQPGTREWFEAPSADLSALRAGNPLPNRLRTEARVIAVHDGLVYLRGAHGPFRASLLGPFTSSSPHPLELIPPPVPELSPGDHVELVGSPLRVRPWLEMSFSSLRILDRGGHLPATAVDSAALTTDGLCDLVRVTGVVRRRLSSPGPDPRITSFKIDIAGLTHDAIADPQSPIALNDIRENDRVELTALVLPAAGNQPPTLQLAGVQAVGAPSLAVVRRGLPPAVTRTIGLLAAGLAIALAGAWWLQHQVRQRTAALAVANDALRAEMDVREKTQAELARALAQEREVGELKSRFVTMVSHEFRTPLGITMSAIELLRHHESKLDPEQRVQLYDDIHHSTRGMGGLMEQVLVLGRVEAGTVGCRPAPTNLDGLAQKLTDESLSATHHRSPIQWHAENDLSGAQADETLLRHIFSNLLSNAVKYSPVGSPVTFRCRREGTDAVFTVRDCGLGIPEADRPHLFEAFNRGSNVGDIPGTGLGLVIVKRCVDLHGGSITLAPQETDTGTTFIVRLPLWPTAPDA